MLTFVESFKPHRNTMARIVRFHETGSADVLKIEEVEVPMPGPGEVSIQVKAIGINRAEVMFREGQYVLDPKFPQQLGYEASGIVESVGADVRDFEPGDPVSVIPAFQFSEYGLYAEMALAPARAVVKHPDNLDWIEAAGSWMQFVTAYGALIDIADLQQGETVLIPAASSSVGLAAIQIANTVGATPVALTRTSGKVDQLRELGAAEVIVTGEEDIAERVFSLTNNKGARVIFDPVGGQDFPRLADAACERAILFIYGGLDAGNTPLPQIRVLERLLTIRGYQLFEVTNDDQRLAGAKSFVYDGLKDGSLAPKIAKTFDFDNIVKAHQYMESNQQIGKIVVTV
jgi:NADPH:quinone reductase-like Zn-dependent oxidoreductase